MRFADGMEEAIRLAERLVDQAEAEAFWAEGAPAVPAEDLAFPGGEGQPQRARLYRGGDAGRPTLLYIHGGGWSGGSIELNDWAARSIAEGGRCNVLSVSYRLAPQHPYPAGLEDCLAACDWLEGAHAALGLSAQPFAIGGASAGANLALAAALARGGAGLSGLVLFYGVFGADLDTASYARYAAGPSLTQARMASLFAMCDPEERRHHDPLVTPLLSDSLGCLPDCCLIAAEHDVLLDDSRAMAEALRAAGVRAALHVEPGVTHGFINRGRLVPAANASLARAAAFVAALTAPETPA